MPKENEGENINFLGILRDIIKPELMRAGKIVRHITNAVQNLTDFVVSDISL